MEDRTNLTRKLVWVQDYADSLEGDTLPQLQEAIKRARNIALLPFSVE